MSRLHSYLSASSALSARPNGSSNVSINDADESTNCLVAPPAIGFPHRLFVPEHYESSYAYPLLVWLHSDHSSEYELDHVMHSLSLRNYAAIALRGNRSSNRSSRLFRWGTSLTEYALNEECIFHAIEELTDSMSIDPSKVFLGGFGKGATVAQWVGLRNPRKLAGVISCNGPFPSNKRALTHWKQSRSLPVLAMQSTDSNRFGIDQVIGMMRTAHCAGLNYRLIRFENQPSELSLLDNQATAKSNDNEFEGSLDVEMLRAANRFMMGIVTGSEIPLVSQPQAQEQSIWPQ